MKVSIATSMTVALLIAGIEAISLTVERPNWRKIVKKTGDLSSKYIPGPAGNIIDLASDGAVMAIDAKHHHGHDLSHAVALTAETSGMLMGGAQGQQLAAFGQAAEQQNLLNAVNTTYQPLQNPALANVNNMVASAATIGGGQQLLQQQPLIQQQPAQLMANLYSEQVVQQPQQAMAAVSQPAVAAAPQMDIQALLQQLAAAQAAQQVQQPVAAQAVPQVQQFQQAVQPQQLLNTVAPMAQQVIPQTFVAAQPAMQQQVQQQVQQPVVAGGFTQEQLAQALAAITGTQQAEQEQEDEEDELMENAIAMALANIQNKAPAAQVATQTVQTVTPEQALGMAQVATNERPLQKFGL